MIKTASSTESPRARKLPRHRKNAALRSAIRCRHWIAWSRAYRREPIGERQGAERAAPFPTVRYTLNCQAPLVGGRLVQKTSHEAPIQKRPRPRLAPAHEPLLHPADGGAGTPSGGSAGSGSRRDHRFGERRRILGGSGAPLRAAAREPEPGGATGVPARAAGQVEPLQAEQAARAGTPVARAALDSTAGGAGGSGGSAGGGPFEPAHSFSVPTSPAFRRRSTAAPSTSTPTARRRAS